jgi:hypothetical protein
VQKLIQPHLEHLTKPNFGIRLLGYERISQ